MKVALVGVLLMAPALMAAQSQEKTEAPRTSWGPPDLQGVWDFRTLTPLERPRNLEGKRDVHRGGGRRIRPAVNRGPFERRGERPQRPCLLVARLWHRGQRGQTDVPDH